VTGSSSSARVHRDPLTGRVQAERVGDVDLMTSPWLHASHTARHRGAVTRASQSRMAATARAATSASDSPPGNRRRSVQLNHLPQRQLRELLERLPLPVAVPALDQARLDLGGGGRASASQGLSASGSVGYHGERAGTRPTADELRPAQRLAGRTREPALVPAGTPRHRPVAARIRADKPWTCALPAAAPRSSRRLVECGYGDWRGSAQAAREAGRCGQVVQVAPRAPPGFRGSRWPRSRARRRRHPRLDARVPGPTVPTRYGWRAATATSSSRSSPTRSAWHLDLSSGIAVDRAR